MNEQFAIIPGTEAHMAEGRVNALDTACLLAGFNSMQKPNEADKKDFGRFLEGTKASMLRVYGPSANVIIYPIGAKN